MIATPSSSRPFDDSNTPGSNLLTQAQWDRTSEVLKLTGREQEVCRSLLDGNTRNEIAEKLEIKLRTVRHYMEHIHEKLGVSNRVGVVLRIIQIRDRLDRNLQIPADFRPKKESEDDSQKTD